MVHWTSRFPAWWTVSYLAASQRYLRDFTTLAKKGGTVEDLVHGMLEAS
jgi:hypothetical protein